MSEQGNTHHLKHFMPLVKVFASWRKDPYNDLIKLVSYGVTKSLNCAQLKSIFCFLNSSGKLGSKTVTCERRKGRSN